MNPSAKEGGSLRNELSSHVNRRPRRYLVGTAVFMAMPASAKASAMA